MGFAVKMSDSMYFWKNGKYFLNLNKESFYIDHGLSAHTGHPTEKPLAYGAAQRLFEEHF